MSDGINDSRPTYLNAMRTVVPGRVYRHFKGGVYIILAVSPDTDNIFAEDKDKEVTYLDVNTGKTYVRNLYEFVSPKEHDGGLIEKRFIAVGYGSVLIQEDGKYKVVRTY